MALLSVCLQPAIANEFLALNFPERERVPLVALNDNPFYVCSNLTLL